MPKAIRALLTIPAFLLSFDDPLGATNGQPPHLVVTSVSVDGEVLVIRGDNFGPCFVNSPPARCPAF